MTSGSVRRSVVLILLVASLALLVTAALAACGDEGDGEAVPVSEPTELGMLDYVDQFKGEKLIVTAWSGPYATNWEETFVPEFEELTGAEVEVIPSWIEIPTKIKAAPEDDPPYDVTIGDGSVYWTAINDALWLPLRSENIPNLAEVQPALMATKPAADGFGAPFDGAYAAIVNAPGTDLKNWGDFWNADLEQSLSLDVNFYYSIYAAVFALGYDPRDALTDPAKIDEVFAKMADLAPNVLKWYESGGEFYGLLERGEVKAGYYYSDTLSTDETSQRLGLSGYVPSDGQIGYIDYYFVVRGTKHRDLAEAFINYLLAAKKQQQWLETNWSSVVNKNVIIPEGTSEEMARLVAVTNDQWAAWHDYDWDIFFQDWDMWDKRWKTEVLGQ